MEDLALMGPVTEVKDEGQQSEDLIGPMENPDHPQIDANRAEIPENPEQNATDVSDFVHAANIVAGMKAMKQSDVQLEETEDDEYGEENKSSFIKSIWKKFTEFFKRFFQKKQ